MFGEDWVCGWRWWGKVRADGGLEGTDGLLLEDVAREEEKGCECEDWDGGLVR